MSSVFGRGTARGFFALIAAVAIVGVGMETVLAVVEEEIPFDNPGRRLVTLFSYFTVLSNLTVAVTHSMLARSAARSSEVFWVFRLTGVLCIAVTGVVYHLALAQLADLRGWDLVADFFVHTMSPALTVVGWLAFGPRRRIQRSTAWWSLVPPITWLGYTLARGAIVTDNTGVHWYPYPFLDVNDLGYGRALLNCLMIAVFYIALALGARWLDHRLARLTTADHVSVPG